MNEFKFNNPKKTISYESLDGFISGISDLLYRFDIDINSFFELIKIKTVLKHYENNNKINLTAIKTGVDRRVVSSIINNSYIPQKIKKNSIEVIIIEELNKASKLFENKLIPKKGEFISLRSILKRHGYEHIRTKSIVKILVDRGAVEDHGKFIKYIGTDYKNKQSNELFFENISRHIDRYSKTVLFNRDDLLQGGVGLYENTIYTTQINPDDFDEIDKIIMGKCKAFRNEISIVLEEFENNAPNSFEMIGVSLIQLNLNRGKSK